MSHVKTPEIIYEDNHILVAVKAPGVMSQEARSAAPDMLSLLKRHIKLRDKKSGDVFLGLVHRLDQPTSGLMVFAKTSKAASRLSASFRTRDVEKLYVAIVRGIPEKGQGSFTDNLSKKEVKGRVIRDPDGAEARLDWRLLSSEKERGESLLLINLVTGRRHQIRAQLALHGLPLLGDRRYGRMDARDLEVPTVALHAVGLSFIHPVRKERMRFWRGPEINGSFSKDMNKRLASTQVFDEASP